MNKPMVYVISGKQGSGKTTLAEMLLKHLGSEARVYKFADILYELHNMIRNYMRALGIERPEKDGPLLQLLGTEWGRNTIDENIWPKILYSRVEKDAAKIVLIDDCRFPNEFDMTRETYGKNCLMVRLECPEEIRRPAARPGVQTQNIQVKPVWMSMHVWASSISTTKPTISAPKNVWLISQSRSSYACQSNGYISRRTAESQHQSQHCSGSD
jgi:energy-coupling factor transporter ATP-binding protein EcfA2